MRTRARLSLVVVLLAATACQSASATTSAGPPVAHAGAAALPQGRSAAQVIAVPLDSIHTKAAATSLARDALNLVTFPVGSTRLAKKPALGTADLNRFQTITSIVSLTRWWSVPGQVPDVTAWFAANPPPGLSTEVPQGGPSIAWTTGAAAAWALNAELVQDGDHVDVSLGSQVIWTPVKTAVETIPASVRSGTLDYYSYNGFGQDSRRVISGADLAALVADLNGNTTDWLGSRSCGAASQATTLTLHYGGHEVVFSVGVDGCYGIGVTSDGQRQPELTCCTGGNPFALADKLGQRPSVAATKANPVPRQVLKELTSRKATDAVDIALLKSLPLPPRTTAEPTPEGGTARSTVNYELTESRWFNIASPVKATTAWFTGHLPPGFAVAHVGLAYQGVTEIVEQAVGVYPSTVVLDIRLQDSGATTAMEVDAAKFYLPTRSANETIPTSATSALLTFQPYPPNAAKLATRRVNYRGKGLKSLITWLNSRPAQWNYSPTCVAQPGPAAKLAATFTVGTRVMTFYWYGTDCAVNVLVNGKGAHELTGPPTALVERLLKIPVAQG